MSKLLKLGVFAGMAMALAWTTVPTNAVAQSKSVEARQKIMKGFGGNMKAIAGFVKQGKGSAADVEQRLLRMATASDKIPGLFPKGTDVGKLGPKVSGAKPDIWAKWDDFKKASANLGDQARKFAAVVKTGDKGAIGKAFGGFGKGACGTCHRPFRAKRQK